MSDTHILKLLVRLKDKFRCSACKTFIKEGTELSCGDQICRHCYKKDFCPVCKKETENSKHDDNFQKMLNFLHNVHDEVQIQYECSAEDVLLKREDANEENEVNEMFLKFYPEDMPNQKSRNRNTQIQEKGKAFDKETKIVQWLNDTKNNFTTASSQTEPNGFEVATAQTDFSDFEMESDDSSLSSARCKEHDPLLNRKGHCYFCSSNSQVISEVEDDSLAKVDITKLNRKTIEEMEDEFLSNLDDEFEIENPPKSPELQSQKSKNPKNETAKSKNTAGDADRGNESTKLKISPDFHGWDNKLWKCVEKKMNRSKLNIDKEVVKKKSVLESKKISEPATPKKQSPKKVPIVPVEVIEIDSASEGDIHERVTPKGSFPPPAELPLSPSENISSSAQLCNRNPILYFQPTKISTIIEEENSDDIGDGCNRKQLSIKLINNSLKECHANLDNKEVLIGCLNRIKHFLSDLESGSKLLNRSVQTSANIMSKSAQTEEKICASAVVQTSIENEFKEQQVQTENCSSTSVKGTGTISKKLASSSMQTVNRQMAATQYVDVSRLLADPFLKSTVLNEEIENALCAVKSLNLNIADQRKFMENYRKLVDSKTALAQISSGIVDVTEDEVLSLSSLTSTENKLLMAMQDAEVRAHNLTAATAQTDLKLSPVVEKNTQTDLKVNRSCQNLNVLITISTDTLTSGCISTSTSCQNSSTVSPNDSQNKQRKSKFTCQNVGESLQASESSCQILESKSSCQIKGSRSCNEDLKDQSKNAGKKSDESSPLRRLQLDSNNPLPTKYSHTNLKTLYTLRDSPTSPNRQNRNDNKENVLQKLTEQFLEFDTQVQRALNLNPPITHYTQENIDIDNLLSTPFLDDNFDTQAIIARSSVKPPLQKNPNQISGDTKTISEENPVKNLLENEIVDKENEKVESGVTVEVDEFSRESNSIRKAKRCLSQFKRYKRIRGQDNSDSDVEDYPQKKACPNLIRDDLSVEFDSNQLTERSLENCDYDVELDRILKNYDENNADNPFRKSPNANNTERSPSRNSRTLVREYSKEMTALDLRKLSPIKRCHDILDKTNRIIRDGKFINDEKLAYLEMDGIEPIEPNKNNDEESIKSQLSGSDIIFESQKLIEEAKLRKAGKNAKDVEKMSESLFSPTGEGPSFCLSRKRSSHTIITQNNVLSDGLDDIINKEVDILSAKITETPRSKKPKSNSKIDILSDCIVRPADEEVISSSDIMSTSDNDEIVETTPQKPILKIGNIAKKVDAEQDGNLTETLDEIPEELDVTAIEEDAEVVDTNNELMSLTAIENCVSVNKMDSMLNKTAAPIPALSPIKKSSQAGRNFVEMAHCSKYNPLVVVKTKPTSSQVILTSTPRQKSILNYLVDKETTSQSSVSKAAPPPVPKTCVIASRLDRRQMAQIMELEKRNLIEYCTEFNWPTTTHVVINPDESNCITELTLKVLWAITYGIWVVKFDWVQECLKRNSIVNEAPFEVFDMYGGYGPKLSRLSKTSRNIFKGYAFYFIDITFEKEFKEMVRYLKAEIIENLAEMPKFRKSHFCLIITNADNTKEGPELYEKWRKTFKVLTLDQEWLSNSIMFCKAINVRQHLLCSDSGIEDLGYPPEIVAALLETSANTTVTNNYC